MPNYEQVARQIATRWGIDPNVFAAQIRQESGFNPNARSGAGAIGIAQIVPRWHPGVDPTDPIASLNYAAKWDADLLRKYGGDWRQVLSVYNSGQADKWSDPSFSGGQTYNYVRSILGGKNAQAATTPTVTPVAQSAMPTALPMPSVPTSLPAMKIPGLNQPGFQPIALDTLLGGGDKLTSALLKTAYPTYDQALAQFQMPKTELPGMPTSKSGGDTTATVSTLPLPTGLPANPSKWAKIASGADRSGVSTHQSVFNAVAKIAQTFGQPLTITTGTDHNQYVAGTSRESQHWQGNAADIAYGHGNPGKVDPSLTRLGQAALVAAGMDPVEAAKQTGGAFNVNGWNILFNTLTGGNHYNHLHVGV